MRHFIRILASSIRERPRWPGPPSCGVEVVRVLGRCGADLNMKDYDALSSDSSTRPLCTKENVLVSINVPACIDFIA